MLAVMTGHHSQEWLQKNVPKKDVGRREIDFQGLVENKVL